MKDKIVHGFGYAVTFGIGCLFSMGGDQRVLWFFGAFMIYCVALMMTKKDPE